MISLTPGQERHRETLRLCTDCEIWHFDNCPRCFGFGWTESCAPISADAAHDAAGHDRPLGLSCDHCGSTYRGCRAPEEEARKRGAIMAGYVPPRKGKLVDGSEHMMRPFGLNPYPLLSAEHEAWDRGYFEAALNA